MISPHQILYKKGRHEDGEKRSDVCRYTMIREAFPGVWYACKRSGGSKYFFTFIQYTSLPATYIICELCKG